MTTLKQRNLSEWVDQAAFPTTPVLTVQYGRSLVVTHFYMNITRVLKCDTLV